MGPIILQIKIGLVPCSTVLIIICHAKMIKSIPAPDNLFGIFIPFHKFITDPSELRSDTIRLIT